MERGRRTALYRRAGHESGRVHFRAPPPGKRPALRDGGQGCVHRGRRRAHGARRARLRAHSQRHLARPRRRSRRHPMHLAGRARHPDDERARRQLLRSASEGGADTCAAFARELAKALLAGLSVQVGRELFASEARRHLRVQEPAHRWAGHADDGRAPRAHQGNEAEAPHRQPDLPGRHRPGLVRGRGRALRMGGEGHFLRAFVGAVPPRRARRSGTFLLQRHPGDESAVPLPRRMISKEQNELMTRIGPGTPAGKLLRRYWQPVALVDEMQGERPVKAVRVFGENLVLYKTETGYGLMQRHCPHRGADLAYGRIEPDGLRCSFHGWKFDGAGKCIETPAEPEGSRLCEHIKTVAYPVVEKSGLLFGYLGNDAPPAFPAFDCFVAPDAYTFAFKGYWDCNWLQALE